MIISRRKWRELNDRLDALEEKLRDETSIVIKDQSFFVVYPYAPPVPRISVKDAIEKILAHLNLGFKVTKATSEYINLEELKP